MLFGIIIVIIAAGVAYLVTKNKAHLSSIEESIKSTVEKVEEKVAPAIEEAKEIVAKAEKAAPQNEIIKEVAKEVKAVKTSSKPKTKKQK